MTCGQWRTNTGEWLVEAIGLSSATTRSGSAGSTRHSGHRTLRRPSPASTSSPQLRESTAAWAEYAGQQGAEAALPLMVPQVPNTPNPTTSARRSPPSSTPGRSSPASAIAHVLGDHTTQPSERSVSRTSPPNECWTTPGCGYSSPRTPSVPGGTASAL